MAGLRTSGSGAGAFRASQRIPRRIPAPQSLSPRSWSPAGEIAVTVSARPRRASSSAIQPPSELPAMWALSKPARVHLVLDGVGERLGRRVEPGRERRRVPEAGHVHRQHVEALLEEREHRPPAPPGVADAVDEEQRLARPAAV